MKQLLSLSRAFALCSNERSCLHQAGFYPDWIIKFRRQDKLGIFDTKGGFTANESEVKDKTEYHAAKITSLHTNKHKRY